MLLGSHNSWSFLPPKKWWQRALAFTARCQRLNIKEQYNAGVRCFDLRLRFKDGTMYVVHNSFVYCDFLDIIKDLEWLDKKGDVVIRVVHDVRKGKDYTKMAVSKFRFICTWLPLYLWTIKFWCGRNLYDYTIDYDFDYKPECIERYASVCSPNLIDDWWPWIYAKRKNREMRWHYPIDDNDQEILLLDYIDIK